MIKCVSMAIICATISLWTPKAADVEASTIGLAVVPITMDDATDPQSDNRGLLGLLGLLGLGGLVGRRRRSEASLPAA